MALAVNAEMVAATGSAASGSISSLTYSFNNPAGTYFAVGATACVGTAQPTINSVTYSANPITKIDNQQYSTQVDVWLGAKATVSTGVNNVVVSTDITVAVITSGAISFTGQNASTPLGTAAKATGVTTTATVNVLSTTAGNIVLAVMAAGSGFTGASGTLSWRANVDGLRAGDNGQMNRAPGNGGTVTMTGSLPSDSWGIVAVEVKAAASSTGWGPLVASYRNSLIVSH